MSKRTKEIEAKVDKIVKILLKVEGEFGPEMTDHVINLAKLKLMHMEAMKILKKNGNDQDK